MLYEGYRRPLTDDKVWDLRPVDRVKPILHAFYLDWLRSSQKPESRQTTQTSRYGAVHYTNPNMHNTDNGKPVHNEQTDEEPTDKTPLSPRIHSQPLHIEQKDSSFQSWKTESSLVKAMYKCFGLYYGLIGIYELANIILTFIRPVLLEWVFIHFITLIVIIYKGIFSPKYEKSHKEGLLINILV